MEFECLVFDGCYENGSVPDKAGDKNQEIVSCPSVSRCCALNSVHSFIGVVVRDRHIDKSSGKRLEK